MPDDDRFPELVDRYNKVRGRDEDARHGQFEKFFEIIAPHRIDHYRDPAEDAMKELGQVSLLKEALIYQVLADDLHLYVCGDPEASSKSNTPRILRKEIMPSATEYFSFDNQVTDKGLFNKIERLKTGWMQLDEFNSSEQQRLTDALNDQQVSIATDEDERQVSIDINFYATANPKPVGIGGSRKKWVDYRSVEKKRQQIPINEKMQRRFHLIILTRPYTEAELDAVVKYKQAYELGEVERAKIGKEHFRWMQQEMTEMLTRDVEYAFDEEESKEAVREFVGAINENSNKLAVSVTSEILDAINEVAKANARLRYASRTNDDDWYRAVKFVFRCLSTAGLHNRMDKGRLKKVIAQLA